MRFQSPPGWPTSPPGWTPPPGWEPDPSWPPAPPGWQFWVQDSASPEPERSRAERSRVGTPFAAWCTVAAAILTLGASLLPWYTIPHPVDPSLVVEQHTGWSGFPDQPYWWLETVLALAAAAVTVVAIRTGRRRLYALAAVLALVSFLDAAAGVVSIVIESRSYRGGHADTGAYLVLGTTALLAATAVLAAVRSRRTAPGRPARTPAVAAVLVTATVLAVAMVVAVPPYEHVEPGRQLIADEVLPQFEEEIGAVAFSPDGRIMATGALSDGGVSLWDVGRSTQFGTIRDGTDDRFMFSIAFLDGGRVLAVPGGDSLRFYDVKTQQEVGRPISDVSGFAADTEGSKFVTLGDAGVLRVWDFESKRQVGDDIADAATPVAIGGDRIAVARGREVQLLDSATGQATASTIPGEAENLAFSPDGSLLAVFGADDAVRLYDTRTSERVGEAMPVVDAFPHMLAFSPDGASLAATGGVGAHVFDTATQRQTAWLRVPPDSGFSWGLGLGPDGLLGVGTSGGVAAIYNAA